MPHTSALPCRAAPAAAVSGPAAAGRRPQQISPAERLERLSSRLDVLIRDVGIGARSHRDVERQIDEAEAIAAGIRAVFRGAAPAQNPPRWTDGQGKAAW